MQIDDAIMRLNPNGGIATIWREVGPMLLKRFKNDERMSNVWLSTYYQPPPAGVREVVMVYDFIADVYPHLRSQSDVQWKWEALGRAEVIFTISDWVNDELARLSHMREMLREGHVVPLGTNFKWRTAEKVRKTTANYQIEGKYLIVVGKRFWYKNVRSLYQGWKFVNGHEDLTIVCVGGEQPSREEMAFSRVFKWRWLDHVPAGDLEALLTGAVALVYPSFYEGFGLPALDAMACGTPVICSPRTGLEFASGVSLGINPFSPKSIAGRVNVALEGNLTFAMNPMTYAKQWTWEKTAQVMGDVLEDRYATES